MLGLSPHASGRGLGAGAGVTDDDDGIYFLVFYSMERACQTEQRGTQDAGTERERPLVRDWRLSV